MIILSYSFQYCNKKTILDERIYLITDSVFGTAAGNILVYKLLLTFLK